MDKIDNFILNKIHEVSEIYPFKDYINIDSELRIFSIVKAVFGIKKEPGKLLDIGSGPLNKTAVFALCGYQCCAVDDLNDPWHQIGDNKNIIKQFATKVNIAFRLQDVDDYTIPFEKNTFDIVMLNGIIEHLHQSPRELLNTAFEFIKTNGIVVVTMPNSVNIRKRLDVLLGKSNYPDVHGFFHSKGKWRGHVREYTLDETKYILKETGGNIVVSNTYDMHVHAKISNKFLRKIYKLTTAIIPTLREGIIVIVQKPEGWSPKQFSDAEYWRHIRKYIPEGIIPKDDQ